MFPHALAIEPPDGDDRAAVFVHDAGLVVALADGSGGTSHATASAEAVIAAAGRARVGADWAALLDALDAELPGRATAVVLEITRARIRGASAGDCAAWLIDDQIIDLTEHQRAKPLLGDGAIAVAFEHRIVRPCVLLVASDGLVKYGRRADLACW